MRSIVHVLAAGAIGAAIALSGTSAFAKTAKECDAEWTANKAALQGAKEKKKDFVTACRAGTETIPGGAAAMPAATPAAPKPTPAAAASPAPMSMPMPASPKPVPTKTTASKPAVTPAVVTASEAQAQAGCPGATVVWVNTKSSVYHFKGTHNYGTTKDGTYMCESAAMSAGDRAAKNEKHP